MLNKFLEEAKKYGTKTQRFICPPPVLRGAILTNATWEDSNINLSFSIKDLHGRFISKWLLRCNGVIEYNFSDVHARYGDIPTLHDDNHASIRQYTDSRENLHFYGKGKSVADLILDLMEAHRSIAGDWIPFTKYINVFSEDMLPSLLRDGYGLLAEGPLFLINEYEHVLRKHTIKTNRTKGEPYERQNGKNIELLDKHISMIQFGGSFIIAAEFDVIKL